MVSFDRKSQIFLNFWPILLKILIYLKYTLNDRKSRAVHENAVIFHVRVTADFILIFKDLKCKFVAKKLY